MKFAKALGEMRRREMMKKAHGGMVGCYAEGGEVAGDKDEGDKKKFEPSKAFDTHPVMMTGMANLTGGYAHGGEVEEEDELDPVELAMMEKEEGKKKSHLSHFLRRKY